MMKICMYGAASDKIGENYKKCVELLGEEIAKRGHTLVYGAGGTGLMGACARGVTKGGGEIIGVAPHFMHEFEDIYSECTKLIETETMAERKEIMETNAEAFVIVPGGIGTYDEFFQVLTLKQLKRHNKPIVLYSINGYYDYIPSVIGSGIVKGFISPSVADMFVICETYQDVVSQIEELYNKNNS